MKRPSVAETGIGISILVLLAGIAGWVCFTQSRFDPAFYSAALMKDEAAQGRRASLPPAGFSPVPAYLPETLVPMGPQETFDPETLSDKIDGKAELYLSSGFVKLSARRFGRKTDPNKWLELFIFQMNDPASAFSVYSRQKRKDAMPVELGVTAYATGDALFFTNGPEYVEIISASKDLAQEMAALAKKFIGAEPRYAGRQEEPSLFPHQSLDESSISLILSDVFGFSGLDRVYTARYGADNDQVTAFISKRGNPEEAADLAAAYGRFVLDNGGVGAGEIADVPDSRIYNVFDTYEVVLHRGKFLAGVHEADNVERAKDVALRIYRKLGATLDHEEEKTGN
ncbi:MAG TPA: DUF6599 family protein [Syntrophobacteraceae bacterium]|nr:DUF6599 family protein [Syntrophobacteraceae bacterium]